MRGSTELSIEVHQLAWSLPRFDSSFQPADIPRNGIYLMFEVDELIARDGEGVRIVRVGTHRVHGRLPRRLRQHFRGNRRASILRRHVASALLGQAIADSTDPIGNISVGSAEISETDLSVVIAKHFSFCCIPVTDKSERLHLERGLIALLALAALGPPSSAWLGQFATSGAIRSSGLWNTQHVAGAPLTPNELERLQLLARQAY